MLQKQFTFNMSKSALTILPPQAWFSFSILYLDNAITQAYKLKNKIHPRHVLPSTIFIPFPSFTDRISTYVQLSSFFPYHLNNTFKLPKSLPWVSELASSLIFRILFPIFPTHPSNLKLIFYMIFSKDCMNFHIFAENVADFFASRNRSKSSGSPTKS